MKRQATVIAIAARSVLAAVIGSLIYSYWANTGSAPSVSQVVGIALIAAPVALPIAAIAGVMAHLATRYLSNSGLGWAIAALVGIGCVTAFPICMSLFAPATNWGRGLLLPLAAYIAGLAIGAFASLGLEQRELPQCNDRKPPNCRR